MFRTKPVATGKALRNAMKGLLVLSVAALAVTIWIMAEFLREQQIVHDLIRDLPMETTKAAQRLAGELRWQFRLTILVAMNLVLTGIAMFLLLRAYRSSQDSLRDITALAGDILSSMDQAVITTDLAGNVTSINDRGIEMLTVTNSCVGQPLSELSRCIPLEDFRLQSRSTAHSQTPCDFFIKSNGSDRTLRCLCQPLRNHDQAEIGNVLQLRDVTEQQLIEKRMQQMERYMGLGSLAAGLHHEIKNPLAALSLHAQLLEEELEAARTSDDVKEMLGVIKSELSRVGEVLENFRDFASLDQMNLHEVDIGELIRRQVRLIAPRAEADGIRVTVDLVDDVAPMLTVDRVRLEQVLLNLFVNAIEAMPDGGTLEIRGSHDASDSASGSRYRIQVVDQGAGIPENLRGNVFDPYFTTKDKGTGMGLAVCDKIVRQHQGTLEFHCSSEGTVFELILPRK